MVYAPRVFACLVLSLTGDGFAQTTWVVDAAQGPGWNFTDIPSAVTAASDGDIIRIRAGSYSWFSVTNKGLRIIGDGSASVVIGGAGTVTLQGTSANQKLWLQGMRFAMTSATFPPTVNVLSTRGEVVLRDLDFGVAAGPGPARWSRLVLRSCAQVHLMDSSILGGFAHTRSILSAVDAQDTFLQISHCTLIGASTADPSGSGTPGSPGVEINRGDLFLTASTVRGGGGAPGCLLTGMPAGQGGAAITGRGGATVVVCGVPSNCIVEGGRGGSDCSPLRPDPSGPGIQLVGGSARFEGVTPRTPSSGGRAVDLSGGATLTLRSNTTPPVASLLGTPAIPGNLELRVQASTGAVAYLGVGFDHVYLPLAPAAIGSLLVAPSGSLVVGPQVLGHGSWNIPIPLAPGWPLDTPLLAQFFVMDANGLYASNSVTLLVPSL